MPLTMANPGECYTIRKVGGKEETRRFLENLGFVVGGNVTVVSEIDGNLIVNVKDSRVAVGKDIMDMGITKGVDVFVRKVAPLGDPVEVTVRGYELSLRKADAEMIEVE